MVLSLIYACEFVDRYCRYCRIVWSSIQKVAFPQSFMCGGSKYVYTRYDQSYVHSIMKWINSFLFDNKSLKFDILTIITVIVSKNLHVEIFFEKKNVKQSIRIERNEKKTHLVNLLLIRN